MHCRDRRRNTARAERLALSSRKDEVRLNIAVARVVESGLPLVYLNMVGGQDELVFDGGSFGAECRPLVRVPASGVPRNGRHHAVGARERHVALPARREGADRGGRRGGLCGLRAWSARLRRQEQLQGRRVRALGRHRLGVVRRDGGRCARCGPRARRDAALQDTHRRSRSRMLPRSRKRSAFNTTWCRSARRSKGSRRR